MLILLAILSGATVAIVVTLMHQRRDHVAPSVRDFARFRAALAATEHPDEPVRD